MLSFCSIGTRVGLIFRFSAVVPLNFLRVQNLIADSPSGSPSVVTATLECIRIPHCVRPAVLPVKPIRSGFSRLKLNSVVSWRTRIGPSVAATRPRVASK